MRRWVSGRFATVVEEEEGGNVVELHYEEAACHDTLMLGNAFGFEESAWGVAAKMGEFVRRY